MRLSEIEELGSQKLWRETSESSIAKIVEKVSISQKGKIVYEKTEWKNNFPVVSFRHSDLNCCFVLVPGGRYMMGFTEANEAAFEKLASKSDDWGEYQQDIREGFHQMRPSHEQVVEPFLITRYPFLVGQCKRMGINPKYNRSDDPLAAQYLYKTEADLICSSHDVMLPTEAQWEYAARGGTESLFYFGNSFDINTQLSLLSVNEYDDSMGCEYFNGFGLAGIGSSGELCADNWREDYSTVLNSSMPYSDGSEVYVRRGGAAETIPWQTDLQWIYGVIPYRSTTESTPVPVSTVRFVIT